MDAIHATPMLLRSAALRRLVGCLLCIAPALWVMSPVLSAPETTIPGQGFGDNVAALWNVWWFIEGRAVEGWAYWTPLLFAPFGTQLSLHTHATIHSLLAWPWTSIVPVVAAHNLATTTGLALNGICTFLLAFRATGQLLPSVSAGLLFSLGAHVQIRLLGHINRVHAWVLPLFAFALAHFSDRPGLRRGLVLGMAGAVVLYADYYYAVYSVVFVTLWTLARLLSVRTTRRPARRDGLTATLLGLLAIVAAVVVIVAVTGGTMLTIGSLRISLRGLRNPLTIFWLLLAAWAWRRYPFRIAIRWRSARPPLAALLPAVTSLVALGILSSPLWLALLDVVTSGGYATQEVLWRSSPPGGDALTGLLGHPRHFFTGGWTTQAYTALGIDLMEQSLWVGLVPLPLLSLGPREWRREAGARPWMLAAIAFAVLSLGPFLRIAGSDTALPLPHALLRYAPFFSNARMPARAIVMVQLALAMLSAFALASMGPRARALVVLVLVLEFLPAPVPVVSLSPPDGVDEVLRTSSVEGAVAELPTGMRDGFGEVGDFDHRAMVHQMHHGRALVGGFVARLSPSVRRRYLETPILAELLRLSSEHGDPDAGAAARANAAGIAFLVLNRDAVPDGRWSRQSLERAGFNLLLASGPRELYGTRLVPSPTR